MKITVITLFPAMVTPFFTESILKRASAKNLVDIQVVNLREFAQDKYGTVDESPYGGGAGMVLKADVIGRALDSVGRGHIVLTSAKGKPYVQSKAQEFSKLDHLVIIAGHYEGVDERIMDHVDEEISLGDFVMTGGEMAAAAIVDSVVRLIPGVLKKEEATVIESFFKTPLNELIKVVGEHETLVALRDRGVTEVQLLEYPQYTRPEEFDGKRVPDILLSGDHKKIHEWRLKKAFEETLTKRPDLLK
ncbi:tRNA (guanosine(37)-N1)-methyltransferase TrmD [Candidatus Microgenomates bacterium]|nr:tRNA (guanosine(37)-N1)-methyltransferase TrmD [Candidatus Microgenomates bacterium]